MRRLRPALLLSLALLGPSVLFSAEVAKAPRADQDVVLQPLVIAYQPPVRYAVETEALDEFLLVQETATPDTPALVARSASRRRARTYRLPSMFGDFYGCGSQQATIARFGSGEPPLVVDFAAGGAVRDVKIAENNSALPRDRLIFNYNFFNDVGGGIGDVNRYTVGIEHTFFDATTSVELRLPLASTLDVNQVAGGPARRDTQFGDLTIIVKALLLERDAYAVGAGLGVTAPIAEDSNVFSPSGPPLVQVAHRSVHVLPWVGIAARRNSPLFWQGFLQLDVDTNGNPVAADSLVAPAPIGVLQDPTWLFADLGVGYWLSGNPSQSEGLALAAMGELHYSTTLQDADVVAGRGVVVTKPSNRSDVVNLTLGIIVAPNPRFTIRPAMVVPLHDDQFDFEAQVQMNLWR